MSVTVGTSTEDIVQIVGQPKIEGDRVTIEVMLNGLWWENRGDKTERIDQVQVDFANPNHLKSTVGKLTPQLEATPTQPGAAGHCKEQFSVTLTFGKLAVPVTVGLLKQEGMHIRYKCRA